MIRLGLTGFPLAHSFSPKLLDAALHATGLEGEYKLYPVDPGHQEALFELIGRVRKGELTGLNVTIPHKQSVIPLLDELTTTAQAIGAVNLIHMQEGRLKGHNTDAPGFLFDLNRFLDDHPLTTNHRKVALVLGAGGSARSIAYALAKDGWQITIAARRVDHAQSLCNSIELDAGKSLNSIPLTAQSIHPLIDEFELIVNTTPVGMTPKYEDSPWPEDLPFPKNAALYDLIYNPPETLLVKRARKAGLSATNGLGMLVEQAILGLEIWTGKSVTREVLLAAVEEI
jgi:shikimate dehydrogenase